MSIIEQRNAMIAEMRANDDALKYWLRDTAGLPEGIVKDGRERAIFEAVNNRLPATDEELASEMVRLRTLHGIVQS